VLSLFYSDSDLAFEEKNKPGLWIQDNPIHLAMVAAVIT